MTTMNTDMNNATYAVSLELRDRVTLDHFLVYDPNTYTAQQLATQLHNYVVQEVFETTEPGLGRQLAFEFLRDVDFEQIARTMFFDYLIDRFNSERPQ